MTFSAPSGAQGMALSVRLSVCLEHLILICHTSSDRRSLKYFVLFYDKLKAPGPLHLHCCDIFI